MPGYSQSEKGKQPTENITIRMMSFLYQIAIYAYSLLIGIVSFFNNKAKQWIAGRKNIFNKIAGRIDSRDKIAWFHAASLGEFEQGRPVIEAFRQHFPGYKILLTFFSPSGYEIRKNYEGADYIFYLPIDTKRNAKRFIEIVNPEIAVFIKYEFWFNYLKELYKNDIPVIVISAIFRKEQHFFKWYGGWFGKMLKTITCFFVQNENSKKLLNSIGIENITVSGDTRFDRVSAIVKNVKSFPSVERFAGDKKVFLAGSTWPQDEELIHRLVSGFDGKMKFIIAPHEIHKDRIDSIVKLFSECKTVRYSETGENIDADILIIDGMGFLSGLYQYCHIAYIGGGFGKGIHNILEAATFGKPVIFGPEYDKFQEAKDLVKLKGAFPVSTSKQLTEITGKLLNDHQYYNETGKICRNYVERKTGATSIIMKGIARIFRDR